MRVDHLPIAKTMSRDLPRAPRGTSAWPRLHDWRLGRLEHYAPLGLVIIVVAIVYRGWLAPGVINWGDWIYQPSARLHDFWPMPTLWEGAFSTGFSDIISGPAFPLHFIEGLLSELHVGAALIERLVWILPAVSSGALATYALGTTFFSSRLAGIVAALFFMTNTYIALILTGGQLTVGDGYMLMPLVLWLFYRALRQPTASRMVLTALCLAIQVMFDIRSTYLTVGLLMLFVAHYLCAQPSLAQSVHVVLRTGVQFVTMGIVVALVHSFWLLPGHYATKISLPSGYNETNWVHALSFMQLSHAFALFHPWWYQRDPHVIPVNPWFYLLPLPIFAVYFKRDVTFIELFLFALSILSIFLVKGANPPAGEIYDWLFTHVPGFDLYRDPSKFYQPLALAYSLLLGRAAIVLPATYKSGRAGPWTMMLRGVMPAACLGLILVQTLPIASNTRWGTLVPQRVPEEYNAFNRYIDRQPQFFRIMWHPIFYPFASYSALHPPISSDFSGQPYTARLASPGDPTSWLQLPEATAILRALSVKYIVVADDPHASAQYLAIRATVIRQLRRRFPSFPEIHIGGIYLFLNRNYLPPLFVPQSSGIQFAALRLRRAPQSPMPRAAILSGPLGEYSLACQSCLSIASHSTTRYEAIARNVSRPFLLVLGQSFDPNWVAYVEPSAAPQPFWWTWMHPAIPARFHVKANGFANGWWVSAPGTHRIVVEYWPQRLAAIGWVVCWLTIMACVALAVWTSIGRRRPSAGAVTRSCPAYPGTDGM